MIVLECIASVVGLYLLSVCAIGSVIAAQEERRLPPKTPRRFVVVNIQHRILRNNLLFSYMLPLILAVFLLKRK